MRVDDMFPMTAEMEREHGAGHGGYYKDEGTVSYIAQAEHDGMPCYVVLGCLDGQWCAEACDEEHGDLIDAGYGDEPQQALDNLFSEV